MKRSQVLLKEDLNGSGWTDWKIAEAFDGRVQTVEGIRQRLVERGFDETLHGVKPPTLTFLDGKQEAQVIAMHLGQPPKG